METEGALLQKKKSLPNRPNYGIDAPAILIRWGPIGTLCLIAGILSSTLSPSGTWYSIALPLIFYTLAGLFLGPCISILMGSLFFKFRDRDWLFEKLNLKGDEEVLDVGCGHGLLLIGAAKRLDKGGKSFGLDLWSQDDQASNNKEATLYNAKLEGVLERVEIADGDMRQMPFPDNKFDAVVSSWAIHNIYNSEGRAEALKEIIRVLKPGGKFALLDIDHGSEYEKFFKTQGDKIDLSSIKKLVPHFTFGNFTHLVMGQKLPSNP